MSRDNVYGIDRFGRPALAEVEVTDEARAPAVFVGSKAAAGFFSGDTVLVSAAGHHVKASSFATDAAITDHSFEVVLSPGDPDTRRTLDRFWIDLCAAAIASNGLDALFPSREDSGGIIRISSGDVRDGTQLWHDIVSVSERGRSAEAGVLFERAEVPILLWYISALHRSNAPYVLSYGSIQHTTAVNVVRTTSTAKDLRGACAFRLAFTQPMSRVTWGDPLWSPIVNGLLVSG